MFTERRAFEQRTSGELTYVVGCSLLLVDGDSIGATTGFIRGTLGSHSTCGRLDGWCEVVIVATAAVNTVFESEVVEWTTRCNIGPDTEAVVRTGLVRVGIQRVRAGSTGSTDQAALGGWIRGNEAVYVVCSGKVLGG